MAYPFSEGMYGMGSGIMNMRRPPNWRKRILPRTPFSSYEAAYSTSPVVAPRTQQTPMAGKKGWDKDLLGEVLGDIMGNVDTTPLPGQRVGETNIGELSLLQQAGPEVGDISTSMDRFWKKKLGYA